jgi:hypothetical protein
MVSNPMNGDYSRSVTRRDLLRLMGLGAAGLVLAACDSTSGTGSPQGAPQGPAAGGTAVTPQAGAGSGALPAQPPSEQGAVDFSSRFAAFDVAHEPNGDLSKVVWPDFIKQAGPEVQELYEFQVVSGDLMKYMPCFCNCHVSDNHKNNRDCYIEAVNPDGSVVFDTMAPT